MWYFFRKLGSVTESPLSLPETAPITTTITAPITTTNWKNKLQELLQKNRKPVPRYDTSMTSNGLANSLIRVKYTVGNRWEFS